MINEFKYGLKTFRSFYEQKTTWLSFSRGSVTALVGPNNAGKSSLLRSIYESRPYLQSIVGRQAWNTQGSGEYAVQPLQTGVRFQGVSDPLDLVPAGILARNKIVEIEISGDVWNYQLSVSGQLLETSRQTLSFPTGSRPDDSIIQLIESSDLLAKSLYIGPYRNIANQANQGSATYYDLPIGEAFVGQWRELKTGANRETKIAVLDTQRVISELLGYSSLDINASSDGKTLSLVFDGNLVLSLADVGAGIAQLIFTVVTAAIRKPSIILIDEPELHLHPTMQAKFLEALGKYAEFGVVFATHSIGLARQVATQVFAVTRDKKTGKSSVTKFEDVRSSAQLLGEMSYSQFSAIGGHFLLLVEGTTEVRTFRTLLRKLGIDTDVLIVPLGGSSLIGANRDLEIQEFQRIGAEVFVLVDSERNAENEALTNERAGFKETCEKYFGAANVLLTQRKATENYLTDSAVKLVKSEKYRALGHYEKLESMSPSWSKNENWKIADEMQFEEIKETDLGQFLVSLQKAVLRSKEHT